MSEYMWHLHFKCECGQNVVFSKPHEGDVTVWHCSCGKDWRMRIHEKIKRRDKK